MSEPGNVRDTGRSCEPHRERPNTIAEPDRAFVQEDLRLRFEPRTADPKQRREEMQRAYTRNNENAPDPAHERLEWTDSPEKEPQTYRVPGASPKVKRDHYRRLGRKIEQLQLRSHTREVDRREHDRHQEREERSREWER